MYKPDRAGGTRRLGRRTHHPHVQGSHPCHASANHSPMGIAARQSKVATSSTTIRGRHPYFDRPHRESTKVRTDDPASKRIISSKAMPPRGRSDAHTIAACSNRACVFTPNTKPWWKGQTPQPTPTRKKMTPKGPVMVGTNHCRYKDVAWCPAFPTNHPQKCCSFGDHQASPHTTPATTSPPR